MNLPRELSNQLSPDMQFGLTLDENKVVKFFLSKCTKHLNASVDFPQYLRQIALKGNAPGIIRLRGMLSAKINIDKCAFQTVFQNWPLDKYFMPPVNLSTTCKSRRMATLYLIICTWCFNIGTVVAICFQNRVIIQVIRRHIRVCHCNQDTDGDKGNWLTSFVFTMT